MADEFPEATTLKVLSDPEGGQIGLMAETQSGQTVRLALSAKLASDLVAKVFYVAAQQPRKDQAKKFLPDDLMPVAIDQLEAEDGRTSHEVLLRLSAGQIGMVVAVDTTSLVGLGSWLIEKIQRGGGKSTTH